MLPSIWIPNAHDLASLIDKAEESVRALRDLNCFEDDKSQFIVHCLIRKLDVPTKEAWNTLREGKEDFPSYKTLLTFLERRLQTLEQTQSFSTLSETRKTTKSSSVSANVASTSTAKPPKKCPNCGGDHALYACQQFHALSVRERYDCVTKLGLCRNCLARSHQVANCTSKFTYKQCHQKHHSKLHKAVKPTMPINRRNMRSNTMTVLRARKTPKLQRTMLRSKTMTPAWRSEFEPSSIWPLRPLLSLSELLISYLCLGLPFR
ncbi:hypothetical protein TKK_0013775 [Trichogramma kaykai]|uniref:C2H2-type domain-containing protein n=1 Tax=Trichogramma kaykai TaxID=54128 RepID=A0ABD2WHW3_9HYME